MLRRRQEPGAAVSGHVPVRLRPAGKAGGGAGAAAAGGGAGGLYHRGVGVLWPAPGHQPGCAHPPGRHRAAGRTGHRPGAGGRGGGTGAGPVRRKRLCGTGHRVPGAHLPGGAGRSVRGCPAHLQAERAAQRPKRPGHLSVCGCPGQPQPRPVGL